jgi:hypothetical protein
MKPTIRAKKFENTSISPKSLKSQPSAGPAGFSDQGVCYVIPQSTAFDRTCDVGHSANGGRPPRLTENGARQG